MMLSSPKIGFQSSWRSAVLGYFHSGSADMSQLSPALRLLLGLLKVTEHQGGGGRPPLGWPQENVFRSHLEQKESFSVFLFAGADNTQNSSALCSSTLPQVHQRPNVSS